MTKGASMAPRDHRKPQTLKRKLRCKSDVRRVANMLKDMAKQSPDATRDVTQDFLTTGRVGRRNALPDILGEHALTTTSDLPDRLKSLSTADEPETSASSNGSQNPQSDSKPSTSNCNPQKTS